MSQPEGFSQKGKGTFGMQTKEVDIWTKTGLPTVVSQIVSNYFDLRF